MSNIRIHKYEIPIEDDFTISLPKGADILSVQIQCGVPQMLAMVDTTAKSVERNFRVIGTGNPIGSFPRGYQHIGTFQLYKGSLVFHLFEV